MTSKITILPLIFLLTLKIFSSIWLPLGHISPPLNRPPLLSLTRLKQGYNADLFYALHTLELEHLGDLNGERRPLGSYDPERLQQWFQAIDQIAYTQNLLPFLVTFYYASAPSLVGTCTTFLEQHTNHDPATKWRWLAHAIALEPTQNKAQELSQQLTHYAHLYHLPLWAKEAQARHLYKNGHPQKALRLFQEILKDPYGLLSPEEKYFLTRCLSL